LERSLKAPKPIARVVDLVPPESQRVEGTSVEEARRRVLGANPEEILEIRGSYALVAKEGERVRLARSLDRPLRYFLAKQADGPYLVVAERISDIRDALLAEGHGDQFHPSYTRMVPAHHVTTLQLVGCPDPNPTYRRFFAPPRATLAPDLDEIGRTYVEALCAEIRHWLLAVGEREPIGVLFSGGLDSGAVLLCLDHVLREAGQSPARLKAFTLSVDGGGDDLAQARELLRRTGLEMYGETVEAGAADLDPLRAVEVIEDYKPLDVECAAAVLALVAGIRERYPDWRLLVDGDGGDENLKDYPIEENRELTIRSVVNNPMLYQEGWGVDAVKHSLTYSGGYSRACVRTHAPLARFGFSGFSPFTRPAVIAVAEAIPFAELTKGSHDALYRLKGEVLSRGVRAVTGRELPVFPKRRFQDGAAPEATRLERFTGSEAAYRSHFLSLFAR
jgi:asparagine synthase (glutamine-hydrolysing)